MTENPGQWGPQGGSQGGYPPQSPGGYPPQQPEVIRLNNLRAIRLSSLPAIRLSRAIRLNSREPEVIRRRVPTRPSRLLVDILRSRLGDTNLRGRLVPQGLQVHQPRRAQ
jgi:hypothetical protein